MIGTATFVMLIAATAIADNTTAAFAPVRGIEWSQTPVGLARLCRPLLPKHAIASPLRLSNLDLASQFHNAPRWQTEILHRGS